MKPYPIIYLPNMVSQERLIRELYRIGYRTGLTRREWSEERTWESWSHQMYVGWHYVYIFQNKLISRTIRLGPHRDKTLVNSINHFLDYTKHLDKVKANVTLADIFIDDIPMGFQ